MGGLGRWARVVLTGLAFAAIFGGGGVLAATLLPVLALWPGNAAARAQRVIGATFRCYLAVLQAVGLLRISLEGRERLAAAGGCIVVANHPSLLDVVLLMAAIPRCQCIVKHAYWEHGLLGGLVRRAGYLRNDLAPEAMLAACRESLRDGAALIIFPEGTRSRPGCAPRFARGFANLALLAGVPVLPVLITCTPATLGKGEPWWRVPASPPHFRLWAAPPLAPAALADLPRGRAARRLSRMLEACYAAALAPGGPTAGAQGFVSALSGITGAATSRAAAAHGPVEESAGG